MIPLFEYYPLLKEGVPHVSLAELPTPIDKLERLSGKLGVGELYIKRDDLTGGIYGGNKVRKLEFLLGRALKEGCTETVTFGAAGSNHALATGIYAKINGLRSHSMLRVQPNSHHTRLNLLMSHKWGIKLHHFETREDVLNGAYRLMASRRAASGKSPFMIPAGGSSPVGVTGFVSAGLELKEQIENGEMPKPDRIYVAMGTTGTAAGLMLGLRAGNLDMDVISVRVSDLVIANREKFLSLYRRTNAYLHTMHKSFPLIEISPDDVVIRHDFFGEQYALYTRDSVEAMELLRSEGYELEGTYTGKAFAALISDANKGELKDKVVLFWNTANSRDFSDVVDEIDYRELPKAFHMYFEEDVQPLDKR